MSEEPKKQRGLLPNAQKLISPDTILIGKKRSWPMLTAVMMHYNTGAKKLTLRLVDDHQHCRRRGPKW